MKRKKMMALVLSLTVIMSSSLCVNAAGSGYGSGYSKPSSSKSSSKETTVENQESGFGQESGSGNGASASASSSSESSAPRNVVKKRMERFFGLLWREDIHPKSSRAHRCLLQRRL